MNSLTDRALLLAERGLPVFPCGGAKKPCIAKCEDDRRFHDASTNPDQKLAMAPPSRRFDWCSDRRAFGVCSDRALTANRDVASAWRRHLHKLGPMRSQRSTRTQTQ